MLRHRIGTTMKRNFAMALLSVAAATTPLTFANSPILIDSANRAIGYVIGSSQYCKSADLDAVLTAQNYLACLDPSTGKIDNEVRIAANAPQLLYEEPYFARLCDGAPYISTTSGTTDFSGGEVISTYLGVLYLPLGTRSAFMFFNAQGMDADDCEPVAMSADAIQAVRNDYTTTGLSSAPYAPPLSIKVEPDSVLQDEIFFDMFDSGY